MGSLEAGHHGRAVWPVAMGSKTTMVKAVDKKHYMRLVLYHGSVDTMGGEYWCGRPWVGEMKSNLAPNGVPYLLSMVSFGYR